ncbi:hypothetical protein [Bacteroides sp. UBA939]|uniref:hypothetical protein n=1 Tax=Bacteroides sp. UBA939 TaxID=1946092 RepID=UPI0025BB4E4E|nr:hypothetical protein [Bacteroides sp. UBA939]
MKTSKFYIALAMFAVACYACDPIEDTSLREEYFENPGTPITQEELDAALSVTQPIPNSDDKVEGDQYIVLKNERRDVPGVWHVKTSVGTIQVGSDQDTVIINSNETVEIKYVGLSAQKVITSKTFSVTVTNVFDVFVSLLTGAQDKTDKTARKTWVADGCNGFFSYVNGHGVWHAYPEGVTTGGWWANVLLANSPDYSMDFVFDGEKLVTYKVDGSQQGEGGFAVTHDDKGVQAIAGELITTTPMVGGYGAYSDAWGGAADQYLGSSPYTYWILSLTEDKMFIAHPANYVNAVDWDTECNYFHFKVKE